MLPEREYPLTDESAAEIKAESPEIEPEDADVLGPDDEVDPWAEGVPDA